MKKFFLVTVSTVALFCGVCLADKVNQRTISDHAAIEIGSENFEQFATAEKPFIIDVWAEWCPPCKMMKPIFEDLAKQNSDYIFGTLDFQKEDGLAKRLQVKCLPTFIVMKGGKVYGRITGALASNPKELLEKINECLANENPTEIGDKVAIQPQEFLMKLSQLMLKPTEKEQVEALNELFEAGLIPDMVLAEVPATAFRPAVKLTATSIILGMNKAVFQALFDHGVNVEHMNAAIDSKIDELTKELEKINEYKKMLQAHTS